MVADPLVIQTVDLRKDYGGVEALRGLSLEVPRGSIYGFLGRNGAGKTTTIKVLLGMARPAGGDARVFGLDACVQDASVEIRRRTGFVSDDKELYHYLTVGEMIRFTAAFFPKWRADLEQRYLRAFDLPADRRVKALSRGMRTKLALLLALCRGAELLILDEPTSGLDPAIVPSLLIPLLSPGIGQSYGIGDALVHSACLFLAGSVFFSLAFLLSTIFSDVWRPLLIALCTAVILALAEQFVDGLSRFGLIGAMSGERYFRGGGLPWPGLFVSVVLSAAMLYGAIFNLARRDF
jgi:ABC-type branched-subunit amino acid transport system ATPase component